jgi:hypothetical protein
MYANEVEESHIERDRGLEMIERFAKSQTQVRKCTDDLRLQHSEM